jgi:hypothetical protein
MQRTPFPRHKKSMTGLLTGTPACPALRPAPWEVAAKIPGVTVKGDFRDLLGRTGMPLKIGPMTLVVNPGNGQVLAEL